MFILRRVDRVTWWNGLIKMSKLSVGSRSFLLFFFFLGKSAEWILGGIPHWKKVIYKNWMLAFSSFKSLTRRASTGTEDVKFKYISVVIWRCHRPPFAPGLQTGVCSGEIHQYIRKKFQCTDWRFGDGSMYLFRKPQAELATNGSVTGASEETIFNIRWNVSLICKSDWEFKFEFFKTDYALKCLSDVVNELECYFNECVGVNEEALWYPFAHFKINV